MFLPFLVSTTRCCARASGAAGLDRSSNPVRRCSPGRRTAPRGGDSVERSRCLPRPIGPRPEVARSMDGARGSELHVRPPTALHRLDPPSKVGGIIQPRHLPVNRAAPRFVREQAVASFFARRCAASLSRIGRHRGAGPTPRHAPRRSWPQRPRLLALPAGARPGLPVLPGTSSVGAAANGGGLGGGIAIGVGRPCGRRRAWPAMRGGRVTELSSPRHPPGLPRARYPGVRPPPDGQARHPLVLRVPGTDPDRARRGHAPGGGHP